MTKMQNSKRFEFRESNFGFTIIELVVSVGVFAIAISSILGVYISVQRLNQESTALQAIQQNVRFITEDITKMVRNGAIDYQAYGGNIPNNPTSLYLIDQDGNNVRIYQSGDGLTIEKGGASAAFTGREVKVSNFRIYILPDRNPFLASTPNGKRDQPSVTLSILFESNTNPRTKIQIPFQITVATKQYPVIQ